MKHIYTVKTHSGFRYLNNKKEALRIAKIEKSDSWPTFVKSAEATIFLFERAPQRGLI